ncbi:hypothetical protein DUI87_26141 [Hirundo rustica rustica]|uniref:HSF-type DNA-binding domain-containing protein n=1 Tax=Hirundo rustica rustica TaxID=333673 RepID=A0A3M0JEL3_HIRRU|nr:hypothetical protein DUI87_26141 [Hirundo rustica rustica]
MDAMAQLPLPAGLGAGTFPAKLWSLVNDPRVRSLRWDSEARGLLVDRSLFERELLRPGGSQGPAPNAFRATQFRSFVRQLYRYGFRKELYGEQPPPLDRELLWMQPCSFQQLHREQQPPASNPPAAAGTSAPHAPAGSAGCAASTASSSAQNAPAQEESPALDLGLEIEKMIREIRNSLPVKAPSAQGNINVAPESPGEDPMNRAAAEEVSSGTESCGNSSPEPEEPGGEHGSGHSWLLESTGPFLNMGPVTKVTVAVINLAIWVNEVRKSWIFNFLWKAGTWIQGYHTLTVCFWSYFNNGTYCEEMTPGEIFSQPFTQLFGPTPPVFEGFKSLNVNDIIQWLVLLVCLFCLAFRDKGRLTWITTLIPTLENKDAAPQPEPIPQPDTAPQPDPAPQPEPIPQPDPAPQPDLAPQPDPAPQPEPVPQPDPAPQPDTVPQPASGINHPDWVKEIREMGQMLREYLGKPSPCPDKGESDGAAAEPTDVTTVQVPAEPQGQPQPAAVAPVETKKYKVKSEHPGNKDKKGGPSQPGEESKVEIITESLTYESLRNLQKDLARRGREAYTACQGEARENRVYWTVWIRWPGTSEPQKYEALVDTGSQCTLIPSEYVGTEPISIAGVTGGSQELTLLEAEVSLTRKEWQKHPIVTGSGAPCILGIDFLRNSYYKDSKGFRWAFGIAAVEAEGIKKLNSLPGLSENPSAVGLLKVEEQRVPVATSTVHRRQYRTNRDAVIPIHKMIRELESQGVVSKTHSPFNSPIWPVRKPDGEWRLTVDYRALNEVTPPLSAAVPDMLELQYELESKAAK